MLYIYIYIYMYMYMYMYMYIHIYIYIHIHMHIHIHIHKHIHIDKHIHVHIFIQQKNAQHAVGLNCTKKVINRTVLVNLGYITKMIMYKRGINRPEFCNVRKSIEVDTVQKSDK